MSIAPQGKKITSKSYALKSKGYNCPHAIFYGTKGFAGNETLVAAYHRHTINNPTTSIALIKKSR